MSAVRLSRLRKNDLVRDWVAQTELRLQDIILPYFVIPGTAVKEQVKSMSGIFRFSIDRLLKDIVKAPGIRSILLFAAPEVKDGLGSLAYSKDGLVQRAVKAIKKEFKDLIVITDVCLCGYTAGGHCGIIKESAQRGPQTPNYTIDNDATVKTLAKIALSHAEAGADFVAPSAMMDAQVKATREVLDKNGFMQTGILSYSAKYASNFYGPFREILNSSPCFGDRQTYQMDYRNSDEALREIEQDISEGADIVIVKPALAYLDIVYRAKQKFNLPLAAYNVSGEYALVKKYAQSRKNRKDQADTEKKLALEMLTCIKRAGADLIITYWAKELERWID